MIQKKLHLAILAGLSVLASPAIANDSYQHDATLTYADHSENDDGSGTFNVNYRYYFSEVNQNNKPYLLTGILSQTSNIGGYYSGVGEDYDVYSVNGEYVLESKWFIKAGYHNFETDNGFDSDNYSLTGGYYFNNTSSVYLEYINSSSGYDNSGTGVIEKSSTDSDTFTLGLQSYMPLEWTTGINFEARYSYQDYQIDSHFQVPDFSSKRSDGDTTSMIALAADLFITNSWSVGMSYAYDFDNSDNDNWDISTDYYLPITNSIAAVFAINTNLDSDIDGFGYSAGINGRF